MLAGHRPTKNAGTRLYPTEKLLANPWSALFLSSAHSDAPQPMTSWLRQRTQIQQWARAPEKIVLHRWRKWKEGTVPIRF